jgi:hypothetical protein
MAALLQNEMGSFILNVGIFNNGELFKKVVRRMKSMWGQLRKC